MQISKEHLKILDIIVKISMDNASRSFSKTIKHAALIESVKTELVDISEITAEMNNDFREMVASMLRLEGPLIYKTHVHDSAGWRSYITGFLFGRNSRHVERV
jgi:chemotaxis protein CheY-P-specific phosphatase CheC